MILVKGFKSNNIKAIREALVLLEYIVEIEDVEKYIFVSEDFYVDLIENLAIPLNYQD